MMKRLVATTIVLYCLVLSAAANPLRLEFDLQRDKTVDGQTTAAVPGKLVVYLSDDYLEFEDRDGRVVHDFLAKQSYLEVGDRYTRRSLYADIGFRVAEVRNRLAILAALQSAKLDSPPFADVVTIEHLFSVDDEETEAPIERSKGPMIKYSYKGKLLAEVSEKSREMSLAQSQAFVRFLRYYLGGHPDILSDLQTRARLPEQLTFLIENMSEIDTFHLRLLSAQEEKRARPDFSGRALSILPSDPLGSLVTTALELSPEAVAAVYQSSMARADAALKNGSMPQAALGYFESFLMQGLEFPSAMAANKELFAADADTALLLESLSARGDEGIKKAVSDLQRLEAKAGDRAHVLKLFRAGLLISVGERVAARDLLFEALAVNPAIAGAWKDLGDIYHANFEVDIAWLCWDVGRHLAPGHEMLSEVSKLEDALRSNYPGFF